jgi:hypothetical protein
MTQVQQYFKNYKDAGFHFPNSLLTTYALSLATKPFVILSGISGTGKTKIAQLFRVPRINTEIVTDAVKDANPLSFKIKADYGRVNFPQQTLANLLTAEELLDWQTKADEFTQRGDNGNFTNTYLINIEDEFGTFTLGFYGQRAVSPLLRVRFFKSNRDIISPNYDATAHLTEFYNVGDVLELEKKGNKSYIVKSVNNDLVQKKLTEFEINSIENHCFIAVRSDWTDNNELLGYFNLIEKKYHVPSFLEFVLTAKNNPDYPFFVILDEMNLSKVEHYFSDILSCSESRIQTAEGIIQESIVLHNGIEKLETDSENFEFIDNKIEIPLNLFITGTVNIDESTYSFSPKVLDRANVIEFNNVDLETYGGKEVEDNSTFSLQNFPNFSEFTVPSKLCYDLLSDEIKGILVVLNSILKNYNLHFGYRVANEIALYLINTKKYVSEDSEIIIQALDYQLIQKVFPKLNGDYATLEEPLREVMTYLADGRDISDIKAEETRFPNTIAKLQKIHTRLSKTGYASFIE